MIWRRYHHRNLKSHSTSQHSRNAFRSLAPGHRWSDQYGVHTPTKRVAFPGNTLRKILELSFLGYSSTSQTMEVLATDVLMLHIDAYLPFESRDSRTHPPKKKVPISHQLQRRTYLGSKTRKTWLLLAKPNWSWRCFEKIQSRCSGEPRGKHGLHSSDESSEILLQWKSRMVQVQCRLFKLWVRKKKSACSGPVYCSLPGTCLHVLIYASAIILGMVASVSSPCLKAWHGRLKKAGKTRAKQVPILHPHAKPPRLPTKVRGGSRHKAASQKTFFLISSEKNFLHQIWAGAQ